MQEPATPAEDEPPAGASGSPVRRRRTVLKVIVAGVLVLALVTAVTVVWAYRHLDGNITTADYEETFVEPHPVKVTPTGPQEPLNILVMGSDTREGAGNNIDNLTGQGERSDTTILVHLSADRSRAYGISIPRDSLVRRPDCKDADGEVVPGGTDQLWNVAFALAGPGCTISQFEQLTDILVDHHVVLDFQGFQSMVDAVDGVRVCIPQTIDDREYGIYLEAGTREISGKEALSYVRERHGIGDQSDIGRLQRQQAFMASMVNKVVSKGTLANLPRLYRFLDAATKSVEVDEGLGNLTRIARLGLQFQDIGLSKIRFSTIPWEYTPDRNRVRWLPEARQVWERIRRDQPLTARQSSGAIRADRVPGDGRSSGADDAAAAGLCG